MIEPETRNAAGHLLSWLQGVLLGRFAAVVAIIAIASLGFLMLTGRLEVRRASRVIFGCFVIFGASTIARGIMGVITGTAQSAEVVQVEQPPRSSLAVPTYPQIKTKTYDPYAGAALPQR